MPIRRILILLSLLVLATVPAADVRLVMASPLGGSGESDAVVDLRIRSDGTAILAAMLAPDAALPISPANRKPVHGCVLHLDRHGRAVLKWMRVAERVIALDLDAADNVYLLTGDAGLIKLSPDLERVLYQAPLGGGRRLDVADDGHAAVLDGDGVSLFDPQGKQLTRIKGRHNTNDVCIDPLSQTVVTAGWRQAKAFDGKQTYPVQIAYVRGHGYDGQERYTLYDWSTDTGSDRFINKPTNNMADTRGYRCTLGRDGRLYVAFEAAGGNHIFRYAPEDITRKVALAGGDRYHSFSNSRSEHKTVVVCLDPASGAFITGQEFCARLSSGRANAVRVENGDLAVDERGHLYLVGNSAYGLPLTIDPPPVSGGYSGGGFLWITGADLSSRLLCARLIPGKSNATTVDARIVDGELCAAYGGDRFDTALDHLVIEPLLEAVDVDGFIAFVAEAGAMVPREVRARQLRSEPITDAPAAAAPSAAAHTGPDAATLAAYDRRLRARLREQLAAGSAIDAGRGLQVEAIDADETLTLAGRGISMKRRWDLLEPADKQAIASSLCRESSASDNALAAFYLLLTRQRKQADEHLRLAGDEGDSLRAIFGR